MGTHLHGRAGALALGLVAALVSALIGPRALAHPLERPAPAIHAGPGAEEADPAADTATTVFLPLLVVQPLPRITLRELAPVADQRLAAGVYVLERLYIPAGVTVTAGGPVSFEVGGTATISGTLRSDCRAIGVAAQSHIHVGGAIDNRCVTNFTTGADVRLQTAQGDLRIGDPARPDVEHIRTDGQVYLRNDVKTPAWEFEVLPEQRSAEPLAPVCSARADGVQGSAAAGEPAEIQFLGQGADPDGGPVSYAWSFGDKTGADTLNPSHTYSASGVYAVKLVVSDDEGQTCTAALQLALDDGQNTPSGSGGWAAPDTLVAGTDGPVTFASLAADPEGDALSYVWDFGDGASAAEPSPVHTYRAPGRYNVSLKVSDGDGNVATSSAAVYVYTTPKAAGVSPGARGHAQPNLIPGVPTLVIPNLGVPPAARPGQDGASFSVFWIGNVIVPAGTVVSAQDGGDGPNARPGGRARGRRGGSGGSVLFSVLGPIVIGAGATFRSGDGGDGGKAAASAPAPQLASAAGGRGSQGGSIFLASGTSVTILGPVSMIFGRGGDGGTATATGGNGRDACAVAQDGASARAAGGAGGSAARPIIGAWGFVFGTGFITLSGGVAGKGGDATATAGNGGAANCVTNAVGGRGGSARATAGRGGASATFVMPIFGGVAPGSFAAGDAGFASATAGNGGEANALDGSPAATGGAGGAAVAIGPSASPGLRNGMPGDGLASAGNGGSAAALASGGDVAQFGGDAVATGGAGGAATGRGGRPLGPAPGGVGEAYAGDGGSAIAIGGDGGGDCEIGSGGGRGGSATAIGGAGGRAVATGPIPVPVGGKGGDAHAAGGRGGNGVDCCPAGSSGGDGGNAAAFGGLGGRPGGANGVASGGGGNGGDGGDGESPGAGGTGGTGTNVQNGANGADGNVIECDDPTPTVTETPITATPATETPVTATPATETPVTATPVTATPVTATPVTETPVTATPVTATSVTKTPVTATPATETPVTVTAA